MKRLRLVGYGLLTIVFCLSSILLPTMVQALTPDDISAIKNNSVWYDPSGVCTSSGDTTGSPSGSIDQFLKAIALHESGNIPDINTGNGAYGKYQYIPATWQGEASTYYPPAAAYATANLAPEAVQDAVAYLQFVPIFKTYQGDIFAIAISHYYPQYADAAHANHNDPVLNFAPPGNNGLTLKDFGNTIVQEVQSGSYKGTPLSNVKMLYNQAPDFSTYLTKVGGPYNSAGDSSITTTTTGPANGTASTTQATIVLDPGHTSTDIDPVDPATSLHMHDYPNIPEINEVWTVTQTVKTKLEADGYKVLLTKDSVDQSVTFRQRADIANNANANLAVSIHDDHTQLADAFKAVFPQKVGEYRQASDGRKTLFTDTDVATKSQQYAAIFQQQRQAIEGGTVTVQDNSFDGRAGLDPGNLSMVQLFSKVPWVYNEEGAKSGISLDKYAAGIIKSIETAVPASGVATVSNSGDCSSGGNGIVAGSIVKTALNLSWADGKPHGPEQSDAVAAYQKAMPQYNGSTGDQPFSDCGVFVSTVMHATGADPSYPARGTGVMEDYLRAHPEKYILVTEDVTNTSQMLPGDILINNVEYQHTALFVGPQTNGANIAQASLNGSVPVQMPIWFLGQGFKVFRLKA